MMAMTGNHTAMATADTVCFAIFSNQIICRYVALQLESMRIVCNQRTCSNKLQVFMKHVNPDGSMHNVAVETKGRCITPQAADAKSLGPEIELMMTSGEGAA
jgi:hypothetical protein